MDKEAGRLDLVERMLYTYSLSHLPAKDKVRFFYALKGRDSKEGILDELGIVQLGKTVLVADPRHEEAVSWFLSSWDCPFSKLPVLLAPEGGSLTTNHSSPARQKRSLDGSPRIKTANPRPRTAGHGPPTTDHRSPPVHRRPPTANRRPRPIYPKEVRRAP